MEVVARSADDSAEVTSAPIDPDSVFRWALALISETSEVEPPRATPSLELLRTLLATRSAAVGSAFELFVADAAFAQIGFAMTANETRTFARRLSTASIVATHLPFSEFSATHLLLYREVQPIPKTQMPRLPWDSEGGEAYASFVVDSTGRTQVNTITILSSAHPDLSESLRRALRTSRFKTSSGQWQQHSPTGSAGLHF